MKAVVLVGGEGTRLRPLTCNLPKPMQPVANRPFMEYVIEHLKRHDITEIIFSMCYLPGVIKDHFGDGSKFGVHLTYVLEEVPLGTAGAVKNVAKHLDDTFFVLNGDILTDLDLTSMMQFHKQNHSEMTISLTPVEDVKAYGLVETSKDGKVQRFIEKPKSLEGITTNLINAGTYIIEPSILSMIPPDKFYMFEYGVFPQILQENRNMYGYVSQDYWLDIGTPFKYRLANLDLLSGKLEFTDREKLSSVSKSAKIHPSAVIEGPVVIGDRCEIGANVKIVGPVVLGSGCVVGDNVTISEAVLWDNVTVEGNADEPDKATRIQNSIIARGVYIASGCILGNDVVISDECKVHSGNILMNNLKLWPGSILQPNTITF